MVGFVPRYKEIDVEFEFPIWKDFKGTIVRQHLTGLASRVFQVKQVNC